MTTAHAGADCYATASRADARSNQHQMNAAAALGRARGVTQRHTPAVVYDDMQACELGRAVDARSFSRISHWLVMSLPSQLVRQSAFASARHITNSANASGSSPAIRNTLAHKHLSQAVADALHFQSCLSSSPSSDGQRTIGKALADGRISFGGQQIVFPR